MIIIFGFNPQIARNDHHDMFELIGIISSKPSFVASWTIFEKLSTIYMCMRRLFHKVL